MTNHPFPYHFIAIEGNIGAGKTTFCNMLATDYNSRLILEQFTDNPFLPHFYNNPERYAFPVELFFMTERHKQLQQSLTQPTLFDELIVADYFFVKTLLFAQNNLATEEFRLFQRLFYILNATFPKPDILIYLHRPVEILLKNIHNRGREFELQITASYLKNIQEAYFNYLKTITDLPVLVLYLEDVDFQENDQYYQTLVDCIAQKYLPKVYHLSLF